jgi:hypothetical protein
MFFKEIEKMLNSESYHLYISSFHAFLSFLKTQESDASLY